MERELERRAEVALHIWRPGIVGGQRGEGERLVVHSSLKMGAEETSAAPKELRSCEEGDYPWHGDEAVCDCEGPGRSS